MGSLRLVLKSSSLLILRNLMSICIGLIFPLRNLVSMHKFLHEVRDLAVPLIYMASIVQAYISTQVNAKLTQLTSSSGPEVMN